MRRALADCEVDGGPDAPAVEAWWGEPGLTPAERVFGWSFYRQGTRGEASSADEFLDTALAWFGDPDPRQGTAWEKGERLARLIAGRRTLLVLDASTGQNAIVQGRAFKEATGLDGLILAKLDGTAKGGVVFAIVDELRAGSPRPARSLLLASRSG